MKESSGEQEMTNANTAMKPPETEAIQSQMGQTLVLFTLVLATVLAFVGLAVDIGLAMHEKSHDQAAADAAVLASVQELEESDSSVAVEQAIEEALVYAQAHGISEENVEVNIPPTSGSAAGDGGCVEVQITAESEAHFAAVLGFDFFDVAVRSVACTGEGDSFTGLMPWAVLESAIQYNGDPTPLKYDSNNGSNGNYGALRLFGSGSADYENNIKYGVQGSICAQSQPDCLDPTEDTEPGNMVGGTGDGVKYRLDTSSETCDAFSEVFVPNGAGGYDLIDDCNPFTGATGSNRVLLVPVVDSFCAGHCTVTFKYFALMFLNGLDVCKGNSCEVSGTFVMQVNDPAAQFGYTPGEALPGSPKLVE
jgi:hypothetical protein